MTDDRDNAGGDAPAAVINKSARELLAEKQAKLAAARERYQIARQMRDEEMMSSEGRTIDALVAIIAELEQEVARLKDAEMVERAKSRMVGISRAHGSVGRQLDEDEKRVSDKIAELQDAIARLNDRYSRAAELRAEAEAVADRFELPKLKLPTLVPPRSREFVKELVSLDRGLLEYRSIYQSVESCEHNVRTRRTYAEIRDSEGFAIISEAGLKPFAPLTEKQQEIVAGRQQQAERTRREFASLPKLPSEGNHPIGGI